MALRRSASADSIFIPISYVRSSQLSLHTYCGRLMMDCASQTPQEWEEIDKRKLERKINDHFDIIKINHKSKQGRLSSQQRSNKNFSSMSTKDDTTSNGNSLSPTSSPSSSLNASPQHAPKHGMLSNAAVSTSTITKSGPIAIPNKLALELSNYRAGNSVEELNQEIENLVLKGISDNSVGDRIPEGHRAPILEILCQRKMKTAKTQTFNRNIIDYNHDDVGIGGEISDESCHSCDNSRSESPVSPVLSRSSSTDPNSTNELNHLDYSSSPKINKFLTREPPDGCEKVKIVNEDAIRSNSNLSFTVLATRPLKPSDGFVLLPSRSSAFLPIPNTNNYINTISSMDSITIKNQINKYKK